MRIWSLLPSATEILFALGLGDQVTGVTHECDYPPEAAAKPRVTSSHIDSARSSREIDEQVTQYFGEGRRLYGIDEERLVADPPDLIVTQDLCPVCAVSPPDFAGHLGSCGFSILTLNPHTLDDILQTITSVGQATGCETEAEAYVQMLRERIEAVRQAVNERPPRRLLCLEWLDPLMPAGHWVPDMVRAAGGSGGPIEPGKPSRKLPWEELRAREAEVIVVMPCGFEAPRAAQEATALWRLPGWAELPAVSSGQVYCVNGDAHFSRPGPRVVEGVGVLAGILHQDAWLQRPEGILKLQDSGQARFEEWR